MNINQPDPPPPCFNLKNCDPKHCTNAYCLHALHRLSEAPISRITIKINGIIYFKKIDIIMYLTGHSGGISMFMKAINPDCREGQSEESLHYYEANLPDSNFFRCHHSHIVNMDYVDCFIPTQRGGHFQMMDGTLIPVSQRKRDAIDGLKIYYGHYFEGK